MQSLAPPPGSRVRGLLTLVHRTSGASRLPAAHRLGGMKGSLGRSDRKTKTRHKLRKGLLASSLHVPTLCISIPLQSSWTTCPRAVPISQSTRWNDWPGTHWGKRPGSGLLKELEMKCVRKPRCLRSEPSGQRLVTESPRAECAGLQVCARAAVHAETRGDGRQLRGVYFLFELFLNTL